MKLKLFITFILLLTIGTGVGLLLWFFGPVGPNETIVVSEELPEEYESKETFTIEVDGVDREFIVYRPESLNVDEEVPVVFMFHGASGNGEKFYRTSRWKELADREEFMVVFPTALKYRTYTEEQIIRGEVREDVYQNITRWNNFGMVNNLDPNFDQTVYSDVEFVRSIVDFITEEYSVDERRIYANGFSSGGAMVARLAVEATDIFAAFASVGSSLVPADKLEEDGAEPRPYFAVLGEDDEKFNVYFGIDETLTGEAFLLEPTVLSDLMIDTMLEYNGLEKEYDYKETDRASMFTFSSPIDAPEYRFIILHNTGHIFPNGTNHDFVAAIAFWEFFEAHELEK